VAEPGWRGGRMCARKPSTSMSTLMPKLAGDCGNIFPAPSVSDTGAAPGKMATTGDEFRINE